MADKALSFDGVDDYIDLQTTGGDLLEGNAWTIELWFYLKAAWSYLDGLISKDQNPPYPISIRRGSTGFLVLQMPIPLTWSFTPSIQTWHRITATFDSNTGRVLYHNGTFDNSDADKTLVVSNNDKLLIGLDYRPGAGRNPNVIIDEVRISNIARTPEEILANWNNGLGKKLEADVNTVALWHMDEGEGDTIFDETENNNDGTIYGASWVDGFPFPSIGYYHGLKVQGIGELALCDVGSHPLRIRKGGVTYGLELVATDDPNASPVRIKTGAGMKTIRKYT